MEKAGGFFMQRVRKQIACPEYAECTGTPITIGFLDTGIRKHPDFEDRIIYFKDFINDKKECYDDSGHGTHVCGIAAGSGRMSEGKYRGISPYSHIVVGKVLDENGDGTADKMMEGLLWMIENRTRLQIRIINISIGIGNLKDEKKLKELIETIEKACHNGILVICAAGNLGPGPGTISPLGVSKNVLTVGCHDGTFFEGNSNRCETYSGRGPTKYAIKKPDIVAPGTEITSCNADFYQKNKTIQNAYTVKSGTSMATPIVTGAAALIMQKYPALTQEMVKKKLLYSAKDLKEPWTKQGWGMLNIRNALMI